MNFYEQELRKLVDMGLDIDSARFVGRSCYGKLTDSLRIKIEFVTLNIMNEYEAIKATVINKNDGQVDSSLIRFDDLFGMKKVSNPNFQDGIVPYIWEHDGKAEWYVYKPGPADFEQLADALNNYLGLFFNLEIKPIEFDQTMQGM